MLTAVHVALSPVDASITCWILSARKGKVHCYTLHTLIIYLTISYSLLLTLFQLWEPFGG